MAYINLIWPERTAGFAAGPGAGQPGRGGGRRGDRAVSDPVGGEWPWWAFGRLTRPAGRPRRHGSGPSRPSGSPVARSPLARTAEGTMISARTAGRAQVRFATTLSGPFPNSLEPSRPSPYSCRSVDRIRRAQHARRDVIPARRARMGPAGPHTRWRVGAGLLPSLTLRTGLRSTGLDQVRTVVQSRPRDDHERREKSQGLSPDA